MSDFHFLRPLFFLLLIPLSALIFFLWKKQRSYGIWSNVCAKHLMPYVLQGESQSSILPLSILSLVGALSITALAGPTWQKITLPVMQSQSGLVIALDLSLSMNAQDVKPSRLQRALYKIDDILQKRNEGQTALLVYTDEAFVVTPLTDDTKTISALLSSIDTSIMPAHGLNHDKAIAKADDLLRQAGVTEGALLLITAENAPLSASVSFPISILGVGTDQGAPIPKGNGGFLLDDKGGVVISKMDRTGLSKLAKATGGRFAVLSPDDRDIHSLLVAQSDHYKSQDSQVHTQWQECGYWLVLLTLPFAAFILRRGYLAVPLLLFSTQLQAGFWQTENQMGEQLFEQEEFNEAAEKFQNPSWKAASHYKAKNYKEAEKLYQHDLSPDGFYNYGNSLALQGKINEAIAAYEKTLELDPDHEDAAYNKMVLEELKQENQNQQDSDENGEQEQQQQNDENQDQQNKDQDGEQDEQEQQNNSDDPNEEPNQDEKEDYRDQVDKEMEQQPPEKQEEQISDNDPQQDIDERWLERIPDDPGGLLRRKFLYQYQKRRS